MARPKKNNADYFSHDSDMRNDPKLKAVRSKYGLAGYAVWNIMLETITDSDGFEYELTDINRELLAGDIGIEVDILNSMIDYFVKVNLFQLNGIFIYSNEHKNRLKNVVDNRKKAKEWAERKKEKNRKKLVSTVKNPQDKEFLPSKISLNGVSTVETQQSKVKESKVKESKVNINIKNINIPEKNRNENLSRILSQMSLDAKDKKIFLNAEYKPFVLNSSNLKRAINFSLWFKSNILSDNLNPSTKQLQNWVSDYITLVDKKNKSSKMIADVCKWAKNNEFWSKQLNSASKLLRKDKDKYLYIDILSSKMKADNNYANQLETVEAPENVL